MITSPDGSYINALSELSSVFEKIYGAPEIISVDFYDEDYAHEWLRSKNNIIVKDMSINSSSRFGFVADHPVTDKIRILYEESW